jgi:hypothetical protein
MWCDMLDRLCAESDGWDEEFQSPDLPPPGAGLGVFMWIGGQGKWHCRACVEITGNKHVASQEHKEKMRVFCSPPCGNSVHAGGLAYMACNHACWRAGCCTN